jgi:RimJ/RimL family protein N-acetyltransferase
MPAPPEVPVLETERLYLRAHRPDDFDACAAMWADPVVTRHFGGKPFPREEVWSRLLRYVGHWSWLRFGFWAIEEKATGTFIGELGFADFRRDIEPALGDLPEVGWILASAAHGRGYATEGVCAALAWGETRFGPIRTTCLIRPANLPSLRVAEKCGFREIHRTTYKGEPMLIFARDPNRT